MRLSPFLLLLTALPLCAEPRDSGVTVRSAIPHQPFNRGGADGAVEFAAYTPPLSAFNSTPGRFDAENASSFQGERERGSNRLPQSAAPALAAEGEVVARGAQPCVSGSRAVIRGGIAYAPAEAPLAVKHAIWAINSICRRPYKWGGGHGSFSDNGYDCSGAVSFALYHAGQIRSPQSSSDLAAFGAGGRGRWITVYASPGRHAFAIIAGLRFDTTDFARGGDIGPRWHADGRDTSGFYPRHIAGL